MGSAVKTVIDVIVHSNVFSVLASAFIPFLPMLPLQLLTQNLLYDISQIAIPFDNVDEELLKKTQRWQLGDVERFMVFFGPISSVFDITTFVVCGLCSARIRSQSRPCSRLAGSWSAC